MGDLPTGLASILEKQVHVLTTVGLLLLILLLMSVSSASTDADTR